ncbi:MAG: hypothetical protein HOQ28_02730 [Thermoleophilia bacterium]|nr:hypothetical protein [Thermoleophilia bacterium]
MSGSFTVGALAVAAREANAVGAVRLTLLPRRLEIELLRAGSFAEGYVPGGLTRFVRCSVPYAAVRGLVRRSRGVVLSLDPGVAVPYNRFYLTHVTDLPLEALAAVHRRRSIARGLAWVLPLPFAAWAASRLPEALVSGALGRGSVALVCALMTALVLLALAGWVETGGPLSQRLRDALERKLAQRMGFEPTSFHDTDPFELPEVDDQRLEYLAAPGAPAVVPAAAPVLAPRYPPPAPVLNDARSRLVEPIEIPITYVDPPLVHVREATPRPAVTHLRDVTPAPAPVAVRRDVTPAPPPVVRRDVTPAPPPVVRRDVTPAPPPVSRTAPWPEPPAHFPPPPARVELGTVPGVEPAPGPIAAPPAPPPDTVVVAESRGKRTRIVTSVLGVAAVVAGLAGYRAVDRMKSQREAAASTPAPVEPSTPNEPVAETSPSAAPTAAPEAVSALPACTCARSDSPLWRTGLPVLSMLPIPNKKDGKTAASIAPVVDEEGVSRYDFDVAIVNNAAIGLRDVRIVVTFARRNSKGERIGATDRGLFWEGELGPARSVKWSVSGPGTELKIEMDEQRMLGKDASPASADEFARLLRARQSAVRLHAAMMLAYLGDPRAVDAAKSLHDLSETDALTQARIVRAASPIRLCDVSFTEAGSMSACAFNGTDAPVDGATIVEVGETLPPKAGKKVTAPSFGPEAEELTIQVR